MSEDTCRLIGLLEVLDLLISKLHVETPYEDPEVNTPLDRVDKQKVLTDSIVKVLKLGGANYRGADF